MSRADTEAAMQRYFDTLGTDRFVDAVAADVTWTVTDTGHVVSGAVAVREHLDSLHAAMVDTKTDDLALSDGVAFLEGDCADPADASRRIPFCVAYQVTGDQVSAMRLYGTLEAAVRHVRPVSPVQDL